ncbi:MAG: sulfite exporter TauE/SafE family protein [Akkermansiaceae bacterium]|nr:sulfite exporter TauE/SafE family protein [Akkermansiaceae bacterium]
MSLTEPNSAASLWGAFAAGAVTSLHCVGMCGLLTCGLGIAGGSDRVGQMAGYHSGRLASYTLLGVVAGAVGYLPISRLTGSANLAPWFLILFLVFVGLGLERFLPSLPGVGRLVYPLRRRFARTSGVKKGALVGLLTPLLPCGPLWAMIGMGLLSGSPVRGAELMLVFALGTVPLLWAMQSGAAFWQRRLTPRSVEHLRRGFALLAALALAWRFRGSLPFIDGPSGCGCEVAGIF